VFFKTGTDRGCVEDQPQHISQSGGFSNGGALRLILRITAVQLRVLKNMDSTNINKGETTVDGCDRFEIGQPIKSAYFLGNSHILFLNQL